jgi:hypothetical protein
MRSILVLGAVLSCAFLAACDKAEDGADGSVGVLSLFDPVAANPSLCGGPAIPFPNNGLFSGFADPTLNIPNPSSAPFVTAANLTDGFSTTASIFTDVLGFVDYATAANAILIFEADASPRFLVPGVDFTVASSPAIATVSSSGAATGTCTAALVPLNLQPISQQRSRLLIEPLKPLNPSTTYIVGVTRGLKSRDGVAATPGEFFQILNSDTKICDLAGDAAGGPELDCTNAGAMVEAASRLGFPVLATLDTGGLNPAAPPTANEKLATLETARRSLLRPAVTALKSGHAALKGAALSDSDLVIAWPFTTQSVGKTLANLNATPFGVPRTLGVGSTGLNTAQASGGAVASYANLYAGTVSLPYFLHDPSAGLIGSAPAILATFFGADPAAPDVSATFLGQVPCGAFFTGATLPGGITAVPSVSTTLCYPRPVLRSDKSVPMLVSVPNASAPNAAGACGGRATFANTPAFSSATCLAPAGGWPVVIFQHGITRNRSDMIALAPTLAAAGFVVIAIDMPLHGLVDADAAANGCGASSTNALYAGSAERTFGVDYVSNTTGAAGADGHIDCSGTHMVNLSSLITSRDNLRQAESDILHLAKSVNGLNFDADTGTDDIAETNLRFAGQSLGAIVGTTVMGVDVGASDATVAVPLQTDGSDELFAAASLNVPGGGLGKLLDASASFGPRIAAGLAASGIFEGSDTYETFVRFAQHLIDPADPINYAEAANRNHPLHVTEVIGDAVVPNNAGSTCPAVGALPALKTVASTNDPPGTATPPAIGSGVFLAQLGATSSASSALLALCPPLVLPASPPLAAITYQDETLITGYLSGTDALVDVMGITATYTMGSAPFASQTATAGDAVVVFGPTTAEHGTLLTPDSSAVAGADATFAAATCAQQKQTATFLASNGALLPIGGSCP